MSSLVIYLWPVILIKLCPRCFAPRRGTPKSVVCVTQEALPATLTPFMWPLTPQRQDLNPGLVQEEQIYASAFIWIIRPSKDEIWLNLDFRLLPSRARFIFNTFAFHPGQIKKLRFDPLIICDKKKNIKGRPFFVVIFNYREYILHGKVI